MSLTVPTGYFCVKINICDLSCVSADGVIGFEGRRR
jgi:hypothetical protein